LIQLLVYKDYPALGKTSIWALGEMQEPSAIIPLIDALQKDVLARAAADALARFDDARIISAFALNITKWRIGDIAASYLMARGWKPSSRREQVYYWIASKESRLIRDNWLEVKPIFA
jgi:hypothetical protein